MIIGAPPSLELSPGQLIGGRQSLKGWYSGTSIDSQDTLAFSVLTGVRSMRSLPFGARNRGLRADAEWQSAFSSRSYHRAVGSEETRGAEMDLRERG